MRSRSARRIVLAVAGACTCVFAMSAMARADIIATVEVPRLSGASSTDFDLATFNVGTGVRSNPGVNTTGIEFHPSIAGNRMVFERISGTAIHIIMRDLVTGQQAELFNGFVSAADQPNDPAVSPDGSIVVTGHPAGFAITLTSTNVSAFPNGPFPHTLINPGCLCGVTDTTFAPQVLSTSPLDLIFNDDFPLVFRFNNGHERSGSIFPALHPSMAPGGNIVVYEYLGGESNFPQGPGIWFGDGTLTGTQTRLPTPVNVGGSLAMEPTLSSDGRYLAFVRRSTSDGTEQLFVWDSQTQLLIDPNGINLGRLVDSARANFLAMHGNIALDTRPVLKVTSINVNGLIIFQLLSASNIGIIVEKVVGTTRVFGKRVPKLRFLGRVPLGHFKRGRGSIRWDRTVNGSKLGRGRYLVTVRSVTPQGGVRDLGRPTLIRIKR
jgi:hypothetical protein